MFVRLMISWLHTGSVSNLQTFSLLIQSTYIMLFEKSFEKLNYVEEARILFKKNVSIILEYGGLELP